jgi:hypothetical protein
VTDCAAAHADGLGAFPFRPNKSGKSGKFAQVDAGAINARFRVDAETPYPPD